MKRASADVGFIFIAYNLRRITNSISIDKLIKELTLSCSIITIKRLKVVLGYHQHFKSTFYSRFKISCNTLFFATFASNIKMVGGF
jgi:hypothetical protein